MPNWCSNHLTLKHKDPRKIDLAVLAFTDRKFCETFVPLPNGEWNYDFCVSNWGTKWEIDGEVDRQDGHTAVFMFDSAWAPPVAVYEALCAADYEVVAMYDEPGMAFCGKVIGDAEYFNDDYREYANASIDEIRDIVGEELDDFYAITERMEEWAEDEPTDDTDLIDELERIRNIGPHTD